MTARASFIDESYAEDGKQGKHNQDDDRNYDFFHGGMIKVSHL